MTLADTGPIVALVNRADRFHGWAIAQTKVLPGPLHTCEPESYDHWIRNDEERARIGEYIRRNPVKVGLCVEPEDWRWSSAWRGR